MYYRVQEPTLLARVSDGSNLLPTSGNLEIPRDGLLESLSYEHMSTT